MLELTGLDAAAAAKRVGQYSLGMQPAPRARHRAARRPGRAWCWTSRPTASTREGVRWIRQLLREHADRGGTVLLSSHLLREVEVIADHLVIDQHRADSGGRDPRNSCGPPGRP